MDPKPLSIREREVLEAVSRCQAVGFNVLAQYFEPRFPADELDRVVDSLQQRGYVETAPAKRSWTISITAKGSLQNARETQAHRG